MMKNESGRSMVEMLGVLAIIGVLSVGGIAGYTMAMNKYKANEVAAAAAQCGMLAMAQEQLTTGAGTGNCFSKFAVDKPNAMAEGDDMNVAVSNNVATVTVKTSASYYNSLKALAGGTANGFSLSVTS